MYNNQYFENTRKLYADGLSVLDSVERWKSAELLALLHFVMTNSALPIAVVSEVVLSVDVDRGMS